MKEQTEADLAGAAEAAAEAKAAEAAALAETAQSIPFGSDAFWHLYDRICSEKSIRRLIEGLNDPCVIIMQHITEAAHRSREIHTLTRPGRGWMHHHAWLALRNASILTFDGSTIGLDVRAGDVFIVEHGWDRDTFLTHCPIDGRCVSGYFLSGKWPDMVGLFMPLFDAPTIRRCIQMMLQKNHETALHKMEQASKDWGWYEK